MWIREVWVDGYLIGLYETSALCAYVLVRYNDSKLAPLAREDYPPPDYFRAARRALYGGEWA